MSQRLRATLWCRDDDATADVPALRRLLDLGRAHRVPIAVAAIPAAADATLADALAHSDHATIVQHGYAHANHAPAGERSAELGAHRAVRERLDELARGHALLTRLFGARFRPVLVPPWNRIGDDLVGELRTAGFEALSRFGPRSGGDAPAGIAQVNTHVDLIAWRRGRRFIGNGAALERLTAHLTARRTRAVDADEPTGLLTHHLVFDAAAFEFLAELFAWTRARPVVQWLGVEQALGARGAGATCARSA
jgi:hypothetical protein